MTTAPITICIDGSDTALSAARWAAAYARVTHTPLRAVHSMPDPGWYLGEVAYVAEVPLRDEMHALGHRHLDAAADAVHDVDPSATVDLISTDVPIVDYLAQHESSLVVLGSGRSGPVRDIVLGGTTIRVVNRVRCPVMIRRRDDDAEVLPTQPVVVGIDGSPEADRALLVALEFAQILHAPLLAAHYWGIGAKVGIGLGAGNVDWEKLHRDEERWLRDHIRPVCEKFPDVHVDVASSSAAPSSALRALSWDARLIVVGSRGRGKVAGAVLGSVSQNVVHHAHCSVLVVR